MQENQKIKMKQK